MSSEVTGQSVEPESGYVHVPGSTAILENGQDTFQFPYMFGSYSALIAPVESFKSAIPKRQYHLDNLKG